MPLYRSYCTQYCDGGQKRDFVYIDDCVDVILWLVDHPHVSGLYNLGTGKARTWLELAHALFDAAETTGEIQFIDMPPELIEKYQYFTEAPMGRLRSAGYERPFTSLEVGVSHYVRNYLSTNDPYR